MINKILVVDDSDFQRNYIKNIIAPYYSVTIASSITEAWDFFEDEKPDAVIVDNILKDGRGYDLCRKIRSNTENDSLPIIMISAMEEPADKNEGFESGINTYLLKPVDPDELKKVILNFETGGIIEKKEKILVIDDSPMIRALISRAFKDAGYEVITAADGEEGIAKTLDHQPAAITCDLVMPGLDGYSVIQRLKNEDKVKNIPIVIISSRKEKNNINKAMELGATDYFTKPFNPENLVSYIEQLLSAPSQKREETILIIEDSRMDMVKLKNILGYEGYNILTADEGKSALDIIIKNIDSIDLVLCDVYLPGLSGIEILDSLNNNKSLKTKLPFIFLSVASKHSVAMECLRKGAIDFISKPYDALELKMRINNHIKMQKLLK